MVQSPVLRYKKVKWENDEDEEERKREYDDEMDKLDKIDKIVEKKVDDMSLEDLMFNLKRLYRENYYKYTDWQINELYNQMFTNES